MHRLSQSQFKLYNRIHVLMPPSTVLHSAQFLLANSCPNSPSMIRVQFQLPITSNHIVAIFNYRNIIVSVVLRRRTNCADEGMVFNTSIVIGWKGKEFGAIVITEIVVSKFFLRPFSHNWHNTSFPAMHLHFCLWFHGFWVCWRCRLVLPRGFCRHTRRHRRCWGCQKWW